MDRTLELGAVVCSIIGAIEMSYVESRIITKVGTLHGKEISMGTIYWRLLSIPERWLFWSGLPMLIAPFALVFFD